MLRGIANGYGKATSQFNHCSYWSATLVAYCGWVNSVSFSGITTSTFDCTVTPAVSTTYRLGSVRNSCGPGTVSGSAFVAVVVGNCNIMFTVKDGGVWSDPTVWSYKWVSVSVDPVTLNHGVTIPDN